MENSENNSIVSPPRNGLGWVSLGAGLAGLSVMLGAFGAHSLKSLLTEKKLSTFHTATDYLGYHALGLIAIGILILGDAAHPTLSETIPVRLIGEAGLWIAAVITLITGYDYLRAGLRHMDTPPAAGE